MNLRYSRQSPCELIAYLSLVCRPFGAFCKLVAHRWLAPPAKLCRSCRGFPCGSEPHTTIDFGNDFVRLCQESSTEERVSVQPTRAPHRRLLKTDFAISTCSSEPLVLCEMASRFWTVFSNLLRAAVKLPILTKVIHLYNATFPWQPDRGSKYARAWRAFIQRNGFHRPANFIASSRYLHSPAISSSRTSQNHIYGNGR